MQIEFDEIYNQWVVWLIDGSTMKEVFKSKTKKECLAFVKKNKKKGKGTVK
jgi:hypothetical protein